MLDILNLIDCMRARTPIWNRQSPLYTARAMKKQLWSEVVTLTGATEDEVRRKWKCLNDIFRREHNKFMLRKKQDPGAEPPQWKYYYHLLFLESQIGTRFCAQTKETYALDPVDDMAREHREDHSLDSSLAFEELSNYTDVAIKTEVLDANSIDCEVENDIVEMEQIAETLNQNIKESCDDIKDIDEPPEKCAKSAKPDIQAVDASVQALNAQANHDSVAAAASSSCKLNNANCSDIFAIFPTKVQNKNGCNDVGNSIVGQRIKSIDQKMFDPAIAQQLLAFDEYNSMLQRVQQHVDDDDYHFALSLVPTMRGLPTQRKMLLRMKIQQLLCEEISLMGDADKKSCK